MENQCNINDRGHRSVDICSHSFQSLSSFFSIFHHFSIDMKREDLLDALLSGSMTPEKRSKPLAAPVSFEDARLDQELACFDGMLSHHDAPIQRDASPPKTPQRVPSGQFLDVPGVCVCLLPSWSY